LRYQAEAARAAGSAAGARRALRVGRETRRGRRETTPAFRGQIGCFIRFFAAKKGSDLAWPGARADRMSLIRVGDGDPAEAAGCPGPCRTLCQVEPPPEHYPQGSVGRVRIPRLGAIAIDRAFKQHLDTHPGGVGGSSEDDIMRGLHPDGNPTGGFWHSPVSGARRFAHTTHTEGGSALGIRAKFQEPNKPLTAGLCLALLPMSAYHTGCRFGLAWPLASRALLLIDHLGARNAWQSEFVGWVGSWGYVCARRTGSILHTGACGATTVWVCGRRRQFWLPGGSSPSFLELRLHLP